MPASAGMTCNAQRGAAKSPLRRQGSSVVTFRIVNLAARQPGESLLPAVSRSLLLSGGHHKVARLVGVERLEW